MPALRSQNHRAAHCHGAEPVWRVRVETTTDYPLWSSRQDASPNRQGRRRAAIAHAWQRGPTSSAIERRLPTPSTSGDKRD